MIVVTTPTGNIGSNVVELLLAAKQSVRLLARDPAKISPRVREQVEVVTGSSDDPAVLDRALAGAEGLFHVVPPFFPAPNVNEHYLDFTRPVCAAMKRQRVSRVVTVSGIGRRSDLRAGVVTSSLMKDVEFEREGLDVRALWCPGFMENLLRSVDSLRTEGVFRGVSRADLKSPLVATRDIAASGVRLLLDRRKGPGGVAVLGPEDLSQDEVAAITGEVLGRPVRYERMPAQALREQLMRYGASEEFANSLLEMHAAKDAGLDSTEPRTAETTSPTWCKEVLAPAIAAADA